MYKLTDCITVFFARLTKEIYRTTTNKHSCESSALFIEGVSYGKPIVAIFNNLIYIQFSIYIYVIFFYSFNLIFIFIYIYLYLFNSIA